MKKGVKIAIFVTIALIIGLIVGSIARATPLEDNNTQIQAATQTQEETGLQKFIGLFVKKTIPSNASPTLPEQAINNNQATNHTDASVFETNRTVSNRVKTLSEGLQIGERIRIKEEHKLFGFIKVQRNTQYEKTSIGTKRVKNLFDFLYT
jgi:hypothetical protein